MDTKIKPSFWSDATVENLIPVEKLALLWLLTANVSHCGWASATKRRFEFDTGLEWSVLERACIALGKGLVKGVDGWWIRNYIRHQIGDGQKLAKNNMATAIKQSMMFVSGEIVSEIISEYPCLYDPNTSPPEALVEGSRSPRVEKSGVESLRKGSPEGKPPTEEEAVSYADSCAQVIIKRECVLRWLTDRETSDWTRPKGLHMLPVLPNWQSDLRGYAQDWNKREDERASKNGRQDKKSDEDGWTFTK